MEKLQISTNLINGLLSYLGSRPYQEVFQLIEGIQTEARNQPENAIQSHPTETLAS